MSDSITLSSVTLNCTDAEALARFYADLTGGEVTFARGGWATMAGPGGRIDFQAVERYAAPRWPGPSTSALIHLDFLVDDLEATEARALGAGARRLDDQPNLGHCLVLADPDGHPFCLTTVDELG